MAQERPGWLLGYQDEAGWSREGRPAMRAWAGAGQPPRLVEVRVPDGDPTPKALACSGLWLPDRAETRLRFVDGRPIGGLTTQYLAWCVAEAAALGKTTLGLVWELAGWQVSKEVPGWIRAHNQHVQRTRRGARLIPCRLPATSPGPNPIEPKWIHSKRRVVEPGRRLSLDELEERVCADFGCPRRDHLAIPNNVR
jgi:hypothetical protein